MNSEMPTIPWLITGASSGLGIALAEHALEQGDQVAPRCTFREQHGANCGCLSPDRSCGRDGRDRPATKGNGRRRSATSLWWSGRACQQCRNRLPRRDRRAAGGRLPCGLRGELFCGGRHDTGSAAKHAQAEGGDDRQHFFDGWRFELACQWLLLGKQIRSRRIDGSSLAGNQASRPPRLFGAARVVPHWNRATYTLLRDTHRGLRRHIGAPSERLSPIHCRKCSQATRVGLQLRSGTLSSKVIHVIAWC